ncbi:MAG: DUF3566 domain-containing protein [Ilumatobacteraceae bacterium]
MARKPDHDAATEPVEEPTAAAGATTLPAPEAPPVSAEPANGAAPSSTVAEPVAGSVIAPPAKPAAVITEPPAQGRPLEPPAPIALPAAPADPTTTVFDDEAMSEPFGIPMVETPEEEAEEVQPLPLPIITIAPTARESQVEELPIPVWVPAARTEIPFEPPDLSTTITSHQVAPVGRIVGRRPRVRKVTRVVRHVDPWSVFKVALVFNLVVYGVLLTAGVLLWNVAYATGTIDNLERFFESFGWSQFEFNGGAVYHSAWIAGLFGVIGLTGAAVLAATLFNLITDLVGGVRFTVLEEEVVERTTSPMRRFVVRRTTGSAADPAANRPVPTTEQQTHPLPAMERLSPSPGDSHVR